jgi:uncharacterized membrane protein YjgN (DUF898 family)
VVLLFGSEKLFCQFLQVVVHLLVVAVHRRQVVVELVVLLGEIVLLPICQSLHSCWKHLVPVLVLVIHLGLVDLN